MTSISRLCSSSEVCEQAGNSVERKFKEERTYKEYSTMKKSLLLTAGIAFFLLSVLVSLPVRQAHAQDDTGAPVTIKDIGPQPFSFTTGSPDGALGALSTPAGSSAETETADDFVLTQPTVISGATIHGLLVPTGTAVPAVANVEVEIYHVFSPDSKDSDANRTSGPPTFSTVNVPTRVNSPADVEIDAATRDSSEGGLSFTTTPIAAAFTVRNTVINGINKKPAQLTHGEGPATGEEVEIDITFNTPLFLSADHYFFRPEVQVNGGNFLFLSAPRPITAGTPFPAGTTDLQAWIRNVGLKPDWLRIGSDIINGNPPTFFPATFNMTFSLSGNSIPEAGTPGDANCHGRTVSAIATEFGGIDPSAFTLGYANTAALQDGVRVFCGE